MYNESIRIEIEAARKDAARYRAIRDENEDADPLKMPWAVIAVMKPLFTVKPISGAALDAAIDAYIAGKSCVL